MSLPTMESPSVFAALLDPERGGRFVLRPDGRFDAERRYLDRSNVLETTYTTRHGTVRVTEALTLHGGGQVPWRELARRVEGLAGDVPMQWSVEPRFDWGRTQPTITRRGGVPVAEHANLELGVLTWNAGTPELRDDSICGEFTIGEGERALLALVATHDQPLPLPERHAVER